FLIDLDEFTKKTGGGNYTRFDIQFIVASAGVDDITNPPTPPEVSHTLDALDVPYMSIAALIVGTSYSSDFTPNERIGDVPLAAADIAGWEIKIR
ncbi:MAG: hypothetical protein ACREJQ_04900, partial [bacterium]